MSPRRALLAAALVCVAAAGAARAAGPAPPNIVFILSDDQGWPMLQEPIDPARADSGIGYLRTPALDRLAREGMRFASGYAPAPLCTPSRRSLLAGMTPARQHGTEFQSAWVPAEHLTLPRALKQADARYATAHFGKWGEAMISSPGQCGYDASDGMTTNRTGGGGEGRFTDAVDDDPKRIFTLTRRAIGFMEEQVRAGRPFYLQVSHYAVHRQNQALPATNQAFLARGRPPRRFTPTFAAMLADMDAGIAQLLAAIDRLGIAGSTYVFFSSDNGGNPFYEGTDPSLPLNNDPLRSGKQYLYEGGIRVPFLVRGPGVKAGSLSREPVALYDLLPTFYDLAGGRAPLPAEVDGASLRPLLENGGRGAVKRALPGLVFHRPLFPALPHSALREGDLKLIVNWKTGEQQLFDLSKDIGESHDLAKAMPQQTEAMFRALTGYLASVRAEIWSSALPPAPSRAD